MFSLQPFQRAQYCDARCGKIATVDAARFLPEQSASWYFVHAAAVAINASFARLATQRSLRKRLGRFTYLVASVLAL
jgi:diacylglycerol kinase family enzyme